MWQNASQYEAIDISVRVMSDNASYKNLRLLAWLRTVTIGGYVSAMLIARHVLQIQLSHEAWLWQIIAALIMANLLIWWRIKTANYVAEIEFFFQLMADLIALFGLLYFTGGSTNPFAPLFILQVIIAAITLSPRYVFATAVISICLYTMLMFWNVEFLYFTRYFTGNYFDLHGEWRWLSFIILTSIIAWFVMRMAMTIRRQDQLLAEAERIVALGTFATTAAHELGTPLATIAVLASELEKISSASTKIQFETLKSEIGLCKGIISQVANSAGMLRAEAGNRLGLSDFIKNIIEQFKKQAPELKMNCRLDSSLKNITIVAEYSLEKALLNILKNALDAAADTINLTAKCQHNILYITVEDNGNGIADSIIEKIGNPGITDKPEGMGIGLYLAKTVLMRLDGTLTLSNCKTGGTAANIILPLQGIRV